MCLKIVETSSFSPRVLAGWKILPTNLTHNHKITYNCYDLKQPSKVNLSVYFLGDGSN
ncbi:MAG: hypothetical protein LBR79_02995 [Oscillospiraceae bacterium]|nr:hypothetical protein [Oscillospiraceae bacterium]